MLGKYQIQQIKIFLFLLFDMESCDWFFKSNNPFFIWSGLVIYQGIHFPYPHSMICVMLEEGYVCFATCFERACFPVAQY